DFLSRWLEHPLKGEKRDARRLAEAVGYLPMALKLVAARVARGATWIGLLSDLEREVAHLESLQGPHDTHLPETNLDACLSLSLNALRGEDADAWRCFIRLAVLPQDAMIAAPMATTLWNVDMTKAIQRLELFWNDALLLLVDGTTVRSERGQ